MRTDYERVTDKPVGETLLVHPRTNRVHKQLFAKNSRCGVQSTKLVKTQKDEALDNVENELCVTCFDQPAYRNTCPALSGYDDDRFRKLRYDTVKGGSRSRPCKLCFREGDGVVTPDDDEMILAIDGQDRRCVHTIPDGWGDDE